jgi:hypothetical protein
VLDHKTGLHRRCGDEVDSNLRRRPGERTARSPRRA